MALWKKRHTRGSELTPSNLYTLRRRVWHAALEELQENFARSCMFVNVFPTTVRSPLLRRYRCRHSGRFYDDYDIMRRLCVSRSASRATQRA